MAQLPESTVVFALTEPAMGGDGVTLLTRRHEGLPATDVAAGVGSGWVLILSGLKPLLETGAPLVEAPAA